MKTIASLVLSVGLTVATVFSAVTEAATYIVNRSVSDSFSTATLTGTVDIPLGNYVIQNSSASPFTAIDITMTVNSTPFYLTNALTSLISGTGQFLINATPTSLVFQPQNGDGFNPADLAFVESMDANFGNQYIIGSNGSPHFEACYTSAGEVISRDVAFPTVFGVIVPEPATWTMCAVAILLIPTHKLRRGSTRKR